MKKISLFLCLISLLFLSCKTKEVVKAKSIAIFVPGIIDNSPVYEMLVEGVKEAVDGYNEEVEEAKNVKLFVMEAGTNQAEWGAKLLGLAASQKYDLIISSNPSLPELTLPIIESFPNQKFILLDANYQGNNNIYTVCYNQYEQSYLTGYIAGLMSKTHKVALIAAQEYPVMNNILYPYFEKGAKAANPLTSADFRLVGNWYDATKGAEIADSLISKGVDVILPICGGASQGVIKSAVEHNIYITWFDNNGFAKAPGRIISSTVMEQKKMAYEVTVEYIKEETEWGKADMVGLEKGYIDFVQDDLNYIQTVPEKIRNAMSSLISDIKNRNIIIQEL
ncbi:MAG: BMP family ABC transporter substrate-binding protein [Treponema sp.]|nr:BMP family ABC transporter substrate-binding protein [Treponema sp.]